MFNFNFIFYGLGILILLPVLKFVKILSRKDVSTWEKIALLLAIILAILTYFELDKISILAAIWFAFVTMIISSIFLPLTDIKIALPFVIFLILVIFLAPFYDDMGPYFYLKQLDKTEAGEKIFSTIEHVEGYQAKNWLGCHEICQQQLLAQKYQYIEVNVASPNRNELTLESGYYRFYLEKKASKKCELFKASQKKLPLTLQYKGKYCIASEKVEQLKSQYALMENIYTKEVDYLNAHFVVKSRETVVINRQDKTVLGQVKSFSKWRQPILPLVPDESFNRPLVSYELFNRPLFSYELFDRPLFPPELFKTSGSHEEHENLVYKVLKNGGQ